MIIEDYNEYYIQGSDHYLIPKDVFAELFNEMINWKEENKKQKEVIDKAVEYVKNNLIVSRILDGKKYYCLNDYGFNYKELLKILQDKAV